jgi:hypothetical protein
MRQERRDGNDAFNFPVSETKWLNPAVMHHHELPLRTGSGLASSMLDQSTLLLLVRVHGCIGLHLWLLSSAVLIAFAALAGVSGAMLVRLELAKTRRSATIGDAVTRPPSPCALAP